LPRNRPGNDKNMVRTTARLRASAPSAPSAPSGPQHAPQKRSRKPSPFVVAGAAFGVGAVLAKLIDWRGHAHPRR
jgi:hypothetical protein